MLSKLKSRKVIAGIVGLNLLFFGLILPSFPANFFRQETCDAFDSLGIRQGFNEFQNSIYGYANCVKFVGVYAEAGLGVDAKNGLAPQSLGRPSVNVQAQVIKKQRDLKMEADGWKLDITRDGAFCTNLIQDFFGGLKAGPDTTCREYYYNTAAHNTVTNLAVNYTRYLLIQSTCGLGRGSCADGNVTALSWTTNSTAFSAFEQKCWGEITVSGLAKQRGLLSNDTAASSTAKMFVVVNQTAGGASGTVAQMCLSWKAGIQTAVRSLFAVVDITDFSLATGDKVNGQWTVSIVGV